MKSRFYLACLRDTVGTNIAFHGENGTGYPTDVSKARTYTLEQAQRAYEGGRSFDVPMSADHVDAQLIWKVDCQYIPTETAKVEGCEKYVAFRRGNWNGNDVYWYTEGERSLDFTQATTFSPDDVDANEDDYIVYLPFDAADKVKRQTFDMKNFNRRTMVQGAGIRIPASEKLRKRRKANPKTQFNCEGCGKIHWQHNPHDFEGCNDVYCQLWKGH